MLFLLGLGCGVLLTLGAVTWLGRALLRRPTRRDFATMAERGRLGATEAPRA